MRPCRVENGRLARDLLPARAISSTGLDRGRRGLSASGTIRMWVLGVPRWPIGRDPRRGEGKRQRQGQWRREQRGVAPAAAATDRSAAGRCQVREVDRSSHPTLKSRCRDTVSASLGTPYSSLSWILVRSRSEQPRAAFPNRKIRCAEAACIGQYGLLTARRQVSAGPPGRRRRRGRSSPSTHAGGWSCRAPR